MAVSACCGAAAWLPWSRSVRCDRGRWPSANAATDRQPRVLLDRPGAGASRRALDSAHSARPAVGAEALRRARAPGRRHHAEVADGTTAGARGRGPGRQGGAPLSPDR